MIGAWVKVTYCLYLIRKIIKIGEPVLNQLERELGNPLFSSNHSFSSKFMSNSLVYRLISVSESNAFKSLPWNANCHMPKIQAANCFKLTVYPLSQKKAFFLHGPHILIRIYLLYSIQHAKIVTLWRHKNSDDFQYTISDDISPGWAWSPQKSVCQWLPFFLFISFLFKTRQ